MTCEAIDVVDPGLERLGFAMGDCRTLALALGFDAVFDFRAPPAVLCLLAAWLFLDVTVESRSISAGEFPSIVPEMWFA